MIRWLASAASVRPSPEVQPSPAYPRRVAVRAQAVVRALRLPVLVQAPMLHRIAAPRVPHIAAEDHSIPRVDCQDLPRHEIERTRLSIVRRRSRGGRAQRYRPLAIDVYHELPTILQRQQEGPRILEGLPLCPLLQ